MNKINKLEKLRRKIDKIDSNLIKVIAKRFKITDKVMLLKSKNNLPREDKNREMQIMEKADKLAEEFKLNRSLVKDVLNRIIVDAKK